MLPGERRTLVLVLGSLAAMGPMSIDLYLPAFPLLESELAATPATVSATMASYFVGISIGQLIYGPVSDTYGRRNPLLVGLLLYILGSVACAFSPTIEFLIGARVLQALGGCAGMVICRALVRDLFPPQEMTQVFSSLLLVMGLAPVLAPTFGAYLVEWRGWRPLFLIMALYGFVCLFGTLRKISSGAPAAPVPLSLSGSVSTFRDLLRHQGFLSYSLSATFVRCGLFAYITGSPFLYQDYFGLDSRQFGWVFGANAAGFVIASQVNSRLVERFGHAAIYRRSLGVTLLGTLPLLWVGLQGEGSLWLVEGSLFVFVASLGFTFPCANTGALAEQPSRAGSASALMGLMGSVTAAFTAVGVGYLQLWTAMALPLIVGASCSLGWLIFVLVHPKS